jgi:hypothetical protein
MGMPHPVRQMLCLITQYNYYKFNNKETAPTAQGLRMEYAGW